jgi:hypothetical protein
MLLISCSPSKYISQNTNQQLPLQIPRISTDKIIIDGNFNDWQTDVLIDHLTDPWNEDQVDSTQFRACYDKKYFYFSFKVIDHHLITREIINEMSIDLEDRVEIFFSKDADLNQYYGLEIDPYGHVMDYKANYYRKFDTGWKLEDLTIGTTILHNGYHVEGKISLKIMAKLGIKKHAYIGIFRADYWGTAKKDVHWYTWKKPVSAKPDFHIPSAFSPFILAN